MILSWISLLFEDNKKLTIMRPVIFYSYRLKNIHPFFEDGSPKFFQVPKKKGFTSKKIRVSFAILPQAKCN